MARIVRTTLVSLATGAAVMTATVAPASADITQGQNGLVNVAVGNVDVARRANIAVAAEIAAAVCGVKVGPVAAIGTAVDRSGATQTVCTVSQGAVRIMQDQTK
jgi:hypothetical protein